MYNRTEQNISTFSIHNEVETSKCLLSYYTLKPKREKSKAAVLALEASKTVVEAPREIKVFMKNVQRTWNLDATKKGRKSSIFIIQSLTNRVSFSVPNLFFLFWNRTSGGSKKREQWKERTCREVGNYDKPRDM